MLVFPVESRKFEFFLLFALTVWGLGSILILKQGNKATRSNPRESKKKMQPALDTQPASAYTDPNVNQQPATSEIKTMQNRTTESLIALRKYHRQNIATLTMIAGSYWENGLIVPDRIESELALERAEYHAILDEIESRSEWQPQDHGVDQYEDRTMQSTRKRLNAKMTMTVAVTYLTMGNHSTMVPVSFTDWLIQGYQRGLALN